MKKIKNIKMKYSNLRTNLTLRWKFKKIGTHKFMVLGNYLFEREERELKMALSELRRCRA